MSDLTLEHLSRLVAFDTSNPPRRIGADGGCVGYARSVLGAAGFSLKVDDLGDGQVILLATRGEPDVLFNVHLDTVPAASGWTGDARRLRVEAERAHGLGACDVKGAAACLLAAAERSQGPAALLLTTDEEAGTSRCVRTFIGRPEHSFAHVVVAEPTGCRAVTRHRGMGSYEVTFAGSAGHSSSVTAADASAVHGAVRWASETLDWAREQDLRLNLGVIEGGTKANVAAESARLVLGMRPWSVEEQAAARRALAAPRGDIAPAVSVRFEAPPLAGGAASSALAERLGLPLAAGGGRVDFWTEAALFAEAGLASIVYGPGSIEQAHAADEWIGLDQLAEATETYERLLSGAAVGSS